MENNPADKLKTEQLRLLQLFSDISEDSLKYIADGMGLNAGHYNTHRKRAFGMVVCVCIYGLHKDVTELADKEFAIKPKKVISNENQS